MGSTDNDNKNFAAELTSFIRHHLLEPFFHYLFATNTSLNNTMRNYWLNLQVTQVNQ